MIERLSEAMGAALITTTSRQFHRNFISHGEKKMTRHDLQSIKTLLTLELSLHRKSGRLVACFPQASR